MKSGRIISIARISILLLITILIFGLSSCSSKNKITLTKESSHRETMTVSPGESITYTLTVKNSGKKKSVTITDLIPANTVYVSGDGEVSEDSISFKISVAKGEEKKVSYTVKVSENAAEIEGGVIVATEAKLGKLTATCGNVYVGETFNEKDLIRMSAGINAISYSENRLPVTILKQMYNVAFSKTPEIRGEFINVLDAVFETEMVTIPGEYYREMSVPTLFGGSAVDTAKSFRLRRLQYRLRLPYLCCV